MFNEYEKISGDCACLRAIKKAEAGNGSVVMAENVKAGNRSVAMAIRTAEVGDYSICMGRHVKLGKESVGLVLGGNRRPVAIVTTSKLPVMTYEAYQKYAKEVGILNESTETIFKHVNEYMDDKEFVTLHNE